MSSKRIKKKRGSRDSGRRSELPRIYPQSLTLKVLISSFVVLNLATILFMNRPVWMIQKIDQWASRLSAQDAYDYRIKEWYLQQYAHLVGLDNQWQMFGFQSRFNWWFEIKGVYGGQSPRIVKLPLPQQSQRTFWQRTFFDFREGKYSLNLYGSPHLREAYAHYLCRTYPTQDGAPIQSIIFELHHQMILPPEDARRLGTHLEAKTYSRVLEEIKWQPTR